jgi:hypothetical protein
VTKARLLRSPRSISSRHRFQANTNLGRFVDNINGRVYSLVESRRDPEEQVALPKIPIAHGDHVTFDSADGNMPVYDAATPANRCAMRIGKSTARPETAMPRTSCRAVRSRWVVEGLEALTACQQIKNICVNFSTH